MADRARRLTIDIVANEKDGVRGLKVMVSAAEQSAGKFKALGSRVAEVGTKMTKFATVPIVAGLGLATKAASDLAESVNVTGLVFGEARGEIDKFAKTAAKNLGQSERAARDATAQFGGLLQNLGLTREEAIKSSVTLTKLSSDLGSAFNKEPAEAVQALGSALRGETEPIRQFNVMLDDATVRQKAVEMGLAATTAEVDKQGKAQATLALIMEQTKVVQGDFGNTSEGLANKTRILRAQLEDTAAKIGSMLIPFALKAAGAVQGMVQAFSDLDPILQGVGLATAAFVAAMGPLLTLVGNAMKAVNALGRATLFLATSSNVAALSMTALGLGIAGLLVGYAAYRATLAAVKRAEDDLMTSQATAINNAALGAAATKEQAAQAYMNAVALNTQTDAMKGAAFYGEKFAKVQQTARDTLDRLSASTNVSKERIVELANEMGVNLGAMSESASEKLSAAITTIGRAVTPTERLASVQDTLGKKTATAAEQMDAFKEALDAALGVTLDADEASLRYQEKIAALSEAVKENGTQFGLATEKQRNITSAVLDAIRAAEAEVVAFVESGRVSADAASQKQALIDRLNELKKKFPEMAGPIDGYIGKIGSIPTQVPTAITVDTRQATTSLTAFDRLMAEVRRRAEAPISLTAYDRLTSSPPPSSGRRASGGPVKAGALYRVGEQGEEWFVPGQDGTIVPNDVVRSAGRPNGNGGGAYRGATVAPLNGAPASLPPITVQTTVKVDAAAGVDHQALADTLVSTLNRDATGRLGKAVRDAMARSGDMGYPGMSFVNA